MTIINHIVPEMLTETDRFSLSSSAIFCSFTPLKPQKNENIRKLKKHLKITSFYTSVPKIMIIGYTVPEI